MSQGLSYEHPEFVFYSTNRTMGSRLWFANNPELQEQIIAWLSRYQDMYGVVIYGFVLMGNHYHLIAKFPRMNKTSFFKLFNGMIAKLTSVSAPGFEGGKLWGRRVRVEPIGTPEDVAEMVFHAALNPVRAKLVEHPLEYPSYNSFTDAALGEKKKFKILLREDYNNRKRYNSKLTPEDCMVRHTLHYARIPGYEHLPAEEYSLLMERELERRRQLLVDELRSQGASFLGRDALMNEQPGARIQEEEANRKGRRSPIRTHSVDVETGFLKWHSSFLEQYREASRRYRAGEPVQFPPGTYPPRPKND